MIDEIHIFGVFVPAALAWAVLASLITYAVRTLLQRLPVHHVNWHPGLLDLTLFFLLWWGLAVLADAHALPLERFLQ